MWQGFVITAFTISPGETRARKDGGAIKKRMWIFFWDAGSWIKNKKTLRSETKFDDYFGVIFDFIIYLESILYF